MARARSLKPGFFTDAELVECPFWVRLLFQGLWVHADRRGILADNARQIKIDVFPADDVDVEEGLTELAQRGFIIRYEREGRRCILIPAFLKHQSPHPKEPANSMPSFKECDEPLASNLPASDEPLSDPVRARSGFFNGFPLPSSAAATAADARPRARAAAAAAQKDEKTEKAPHPTCAFCADIGPELFAAYAAKFTDVNAALSRTWLKRTVTQYEAEGLSLPPPVMIDALSVALTRIAEALEHENGIHHPAAWAAGQIGEAMREAAEMRA